MLLKFLNVKLMKFSKLLAPNDSDQKQAMQRK
jgi:hypothetical protein